MEAQHHLRSNLPANAAVDIRLAGKIFRQIPQVSNGIAEKHYAAFTCFGQAQLPIGFMVQIFLPEILHQPWHEFFFVWPQPAPKVLRHSLLPRR